VKAERTVKTDVQSSYITSHQRGAAKKPITAQHHPQATDRPRAAAWRETRPINARIWSFLFRCVLVYPQKETLIKERSLGVPCSQLTAR
jgi:hypothetical protein